MNPGDRAIWGSIVILLACVAVREWQDAPAIEWPELPGWIWLGETEPSADDIDLTPGAKLILDADEPDPILYPSVDDTIEVHTGRKIANVKDGEIEPQNEAIKWRNQTWIREAGDGDLDANQ